MYQEIIGLFNRWHNIIPIVWHNPVHGNYVFHAILLTFWEASFSGLHAIKEIRNASSGGTIVIRHTGPIQMPKGGYPSLKR
jgi:hypothetical protein